MKLGKHAVKVLAVFAVLFVVGFALKFLNLHEGFVVASEYKTDASGNNEYGTFMTAALNEANDADLEKRKRSNNNNNNNNNNDDDLPKATKRRRIRQRTQSRR
jgi:hypothetical protein